MATKTIKKPAKWKRLTFLIKSFKEILSKSQRVYPPYNHTTTKT